MQTCFTVKILVAFVVREREKGRENFFTADFLLKLVLYTDKIRVSIRSVSTVIWSLI